jgi:O-antigen/teichoic acid export membrane protein
VSPFRNILRLFAGDFAAKSLQFVTFIYLARTLAPERYGVLEFALAATSYLLLAADCGLELWATREVSHERDIRRLAGRVLGLRLALGALAYAIFVVLIPAFPNYPSLRALLLLGGLLVAANALSLRWALLGRERLAVVASSLVAAQLVSTVLVLLLVRDATGLIWVLVARAAGEFALAGLYARQFVREAGGTPAPPTLAGWRETIGPAAVIGAIQILGVLSYNFDSILLGILSGPAAVGLYGAAYKVVTVAVAATMTYYTGLFPALARTWIDGRVQFLEVAHRAFHLAALAALPVGVAGSILAGVAIEFLYGPAYAAAAPALRVLCWSAAFVSLRGTFRNGLTATGAQNLDLRCAAIATTVNIGLNLLFIPRFGMIGAATATVSADVVWFALAWYYFARRCGGVGFASVFWRPAVASGFMALAVFTVLALPLAGDTLPPGLRAGLALAICAIVGSSVYVTTLLLLREPEFRRNRGRGSS